MIKHPDKARKKVCFMISVQLACVTSISARVHQESWEESKKNWLETLGTQATVQLVGYVVV